MATYLYAVIFEHLISGSRWSSCINTNLYLPLLNKKAHQALKGHTDLKEIRHIPLHNYSNILVNCLNLYNDQSAGAL